MKSMEPLVQSISTKYKTSGDDSNTVYTASAILSWRTAEQYPQTHFLVMFVFIHLPITQRGNMVFINMFRTEHRPVELSLSALSTGSSWDWPWWLGRHSGGRCCQWTHPRPQFNLENKCASNITREISQPQSYHCLRDSFRQNDQSWLLSGAWESNLCTVQTDMKEIMVNMRDILRISNTVCDNKAIPIAKSLVAILFSVTEIFVESHWILYGNKRHRLPLQGQMNSNVFHFCWFYLTYF